MKCDSKDIYNFPRKNLFNLSIHQKILIMFHKNIKQHNNFNIIRKKCFLNNIIYIQKLLLFLKDHVTLKTEEMMLIQFSFIITGTNDILKYIKTDNGSLKL